MRAKLYASFVLPTVALLALSAIVTAGTAVEAVTAERVVGLAELSSASAELASLLSKERAAAALSNIDAQSDPQMRQFVAAAASSDAAVGVWRSRLAAADVAPGLMSLALQRAGRLLDGLGEVRGMVRSPKNTVLSVLVLRYRLVIAALVDVQLSLVVAGAPTQIADRMRALAAFSQASEAIGQQQIAVLRAIAAGRMTPAWSGLVAAARSSYVEALQVADTAGDGVWRVWLDSALSGEDIVAAQRAEGAVSRVVTGDPVPVAAGEWVTVQQARQGQLREVGRRAEAQVAVQLRQWRDGQARLAIRASGAAGAVLLLALAWAWFLARRMSRSLESLRSSAFAVAETGLPRAVLALAQRDDLTHAPAVFAAEQVATPLAVRGHDEVAQVASSFNAIQLTALRLAAEQEQGKHRLAAMFLTVGLRAQAILDRLMSKLDQIERDEYDPDRLELLFAIDHLTARMRLGNARLLLLGGKPSQSRYADPVPLADVLVAAVSQVDDYRRVDRNDVDLDLMLRPHVIADLTLALAELMNNACMFAPPDAPVRASARRIGDRAVVSIRDDGVGMSAEELAHANALLADGWQLNLPAIRWMGLAVVARVAAMHGLHIRLDSKPRQGTTAEVLLPATVLVRSTPSSSGIGPDTVMALRQNRRAPEPQSTLATWITHDAYTQDTELGTESGLPQRHRKALAVQTQQLPVVRRDLRLRHHELSVLQASIKAAKQAGLITSNPMRTPS